jgi:ribosomal protein S18 acetylase RimI-like enzyme
MRENINLKSIRIRKPRVKDLPQIIGIQEAITKATVSPERKAILRVQLQKKENISLVAFSEDKLLGYVISEVMTNSFGIDQGGWIQNLGVLPKYMGQGIGKALGIALFEAYKKRKIFEIYTAVQWDSVDMLSFFKSIGFDRSNFINLYKRLE